MENLCRKLANLNPLEIDPENPCLKFEINLLEIRRSGKWDPFPPLKGTFRDFSTGISEVLFDTGNLVGYCVLTGNYFDDFRTYFPYLTFSSRKLETPTRNSHILVSNEKIDFRFNGNTNFQSRIGFISAIPLNFISRINIGMNAICQFASVIMPGAFYCMNFEGKE